MSAPALPVPSDSPAPIARRLLSLSGVVPLGAFLLVHLFVNAYAVRGNLAFAAAVGVIERTPALGLIEVLFIWGPLLVHAVLGLWLIATDKPLTSPSPYSAPVSWAMRGTGAVAVAFLALHLPELRFRAHGTRLGGGELATLLAYDLSSTAHGVPWCGVIYLFATGCVVFHFATGLWGFFAASQGGRASERARRYGAWLALALGGALWLAFADIVVFHATGVGFL